MKKAKFMLVAIAAVAIVGGATAFNSLKKLYYLNKSGATVTVTDATISTSVAGEATIATPSDFAVGFYTTSIFPTTTTLSTFAGYLPITD